MWNVTYMSTVYKHVYASTNWRLVSETNDLRPRLRDKKLNSIEWEAIFIRHISYYAYREWLWLGCLICIDILALFHFVFIQWSFAEINNLLLLLLDFSYSLFSEDSHNNLYNNL